jgi:glutamate racemase
MQMAMGSIGVFDSGVGGLTVVRALRAALPAEPILYLGDTARFPYGSKSPATVLRYARGNARFLVERGVKLLLIACNTASAFALDTLRSELEVPVLGAVVPGAEEAVACSRRRRIGVLGTIGTVQSGSYARAIHALAPEAAVAAQACPLLVPLAEEGWTNGDVPRLVVERYLGELHGSDPEIDTLVLGCTHYPLLKGAIAEAGERLFGRPLWMVDSAGAMARAARAALSQRNLLADGQGSLGCFVTDRSRFAEVGGRLFGGPLADVEQVDLG